MRPSRALLLASLFVLFASVPAAAQIPGLPKGFTASTVPAPLQVSIAEAAPDSPRSTVAEFLGLTRAGRYAEAARFLDVPAALAGRGPELAKKLRLVLDARLWIDLAKVSPLPPGQLEDGLPPELEEIGSITGTTGKPEPVRLIRKDRVESPIWVFSRSTVAHVPAWYAALGNHELLDRIPAPLLRPGPQQLLLWQWLAALALLVPAWWGGKALGWASRKVLLRLARRTSTKWDEALLLRMRGPFTLGWTLVILRSGLPFLELYAPAEEFAVQILRSGAIVAFFWATMRTITVAGDVLGEEPWATANPGARAFLQFSVRFGRIFVIGMGFLAALAALGIPVNSVLAGLGIGGIAIAFAAQKTVENFFGAISIGVDQPLRVGDYVRVSGVEGTVEKIGLRSTRLRTLDRTLVTIPNGKLADMQIETFAERDRIRLAATVSLAYGTTAAQMREVVAGIEALLRAHPKIWPDTVVVRFLGFAESSLNVELMAWFLTIDVDEFRGIRQEVLLGMMEIVENAGTTFASPTRTVHLVGPGASAAAQAE
ncbi:MAG TPA: mechanosensitive ion channel family protein [Thermoanaerobaculia bacterium]|nr:mechanosensitive ion channel family protein [Thermoanaerobaculia bacterium]